MPKLNYKVVKSDEDVDEKMYQIFKRIRRWLTVYDTKSCCSSCDRNEGRQARSIFKDLCDAVVAYREYRNGNNASD
jgi:CRISPR/Cas system CSM-associated protein Csm2 small subunit